MKKVWTILKILLTVFLVWFIFRKVDLQATWTALKSVNPVWYLVVLALNLLQNFFTIMRWHYMLNFNNIRISLWQATKYHFISLIFMTVIPSGFGADAAKFALTGQKGQRAESLNSVFVARMAGFFVLTVFAFLGSIFYKIEKFPHLMLWLGLVIAAAVAAVLLIRHIPFERLRIWEGSKFMTNALKFIRNLKSNLTPRLLWPVTGITVLQQVTAVLPYYFIFLALGLKTSIFKTVVAVPLITLLTTVIPTIAGAGTREWLLSLFFRQELADSAILATFAAVFYSIFLILILIGLVFWIQSMAKKRQER